MLSLRDLARERGVCGLLALQSITYKDDTDTPSVFPSIKRRPGLGRTFGFLVDTQVMVDVVLKQHGGKEWVNVIEVLYSRTHHTEGKYGLFCVNGVGDLVESP